MCVCVRKKCVCVCGIEREGKVLILKREKLRNVTAADDVCDVGSV